MTMKAATDDKDPYNDGYTHEALHSAHICISMWDEFVTDTRCADQYPDIKKAAAKAWARSNFGGPKPCIKCECEIEEWWNYCARCGYHLAANPPVK